MPLSTEDIWKEFHDPLKKFVAKRVHNEYDVEDILQITFCKIHDHITDLSDKTKFHAWMYRIARNTIIDYYRSQVVTIELTDLPEISVEDEFLSSETCREVAACLKNILQHLPDKYREAIILTEFEQLTQRELAARLGLSHSGAKSRVQRARAKFKDILLRCCYVEFDRLGNVIDYKRKRDSCIYC